LGHPTKNDFVKATEVCPSGWHLPSYDEWETLTKYVDPNWTSNDGNGNVSATKLKASSGWVRIATDIPEGNGTDDYGFAALPGGYSHDGNAFWWPGTYTYWWSSTGGIYAYAPHINSHSDYVYKHTQSEEAFYSVRCLKD
jgi:uncharacterized protein (TIGR02145 family)